MKNNLGLIIAIFIFMGCSNPTPPIQNVVKLPKKTMRKALGTPSQLALGSQHSCALFSSGQVMCWGSSANGQLGEIDGKKIRATHPHLLPYVTDGVAIDSIGYQTCVLRKNGTVICFGDDGSKKDMRPIPGLSNAKNIAVGQSTACASNPTGLWCWGKSTNGQIPGTLEARSQSAIKLERVFEKIIASETSFFGLGKSGWQGWGKNQDNVFRSEAHKLNGFTKIKDTESFIGVVSRGGVACGWSPTKVLCWAEMDKSGANLEPKGIVGDIEKVVVGEEFACALAEKKIFCWGGNAKGTLGDGTRNGRPDALAVEGLEGVTDIDAGALHVCAVTNKGVYCWGNSDSGETGVDSRIVKSRPVKLKFVGMEGKKY